MIMIHDVKSVIHTKVVVLWYRSVNIERLTIDFGILSSLFPHQNLIQVPMELLWYTPPKKCNRTHISYYFSVQ